MPEPAVLAADLAFGLLLGCVFAVIAHGLNLIWGIAKIVNVAHGEFIMIGAYGAYFLNLWFGFSPLLSAPVDAAIGLAVGLGFYFGFLYREIRGKESIGLRSEMVTLVSTFGLALFTTNVALRVWSPNFVGIPWSPGVVEIGFLRLPLGAVYVQDIPAAQLLGIDPTLVGAIGIALGFSVTMAGGALLTVWLPTGINPGMGALYAPISFVIVVLGGPGKMWGSLVGGITIAVIIDVGQAFVGLSLATAIAFLTLIPILLFRPEGILR